MCLTPSFVPSAAPLASSCAAPLAPCARPRGLLSGARASTARARVRMRAPAPPNEYDGAVPAAAAAPPAAPAPAASGAATDPALAATPPFAAPTAADGVEDSKSVSIRRQMEFWFSPANLRRDWYLRRQMDDDGWLDPAVFLKFNRLKQLNVSLDEVIDACKASDVLEVSAPPADGASFGDALGQTRIRRSVNLPTIYSDVGSEAERSIVAENLPEGLSVATLRTMFAAYGEVSYTWVSRPSAKDGHHAIVSFTDSGMALQALEEFEQSRPQDCGGMTIKSKVIWDASLARARNKSIVLELSGLSNDLMWRTLWKDITDRLSSSGIQIIYFLYNNGDSKCYITVADHETADAVVAQLTVDDAVVVAGVQVDARALTDADDLSEYWSKASAQSLERKKKKERVSQLRIQDGDVEMSTPAGVIVRIEGLPSTLAWKPLMEELNTFANVVFLSYRKGDTKCFVRYQYPNVATEVVEKLTESPPSLLGGSDVTAYVLEGEEEVKYWNRWYERRRRRQMHSAKV